jgi:sulfate adenylyltransferase subunit 1
VLPSGRQTTVARIVTYEGDLPRALAGQSVTLTLADDIDVSRGDMIAAIEDAPLVADRLHVRLFWTGARALRVGNLFEVKIGTTTARARAESIVQRIDPDTGAHQDADALEPNDIGDVVLALDRAVACDPYVRSRETGSFILIDRESCDTVGLGLVLEA